MKRNIIITVILLISGIYANSQQTKPFSAEEINNARKLQAAYSAIVDLYVDETDNKKIVEDAIIGMLEKLDPHSAYTNAEETRRMQEPLEAHFDGIGIEFNMFEDTLLVLNVISGGPSEKVGLLAGDRIVQVDTTVIAGVKMVNTDIVKLIRGPKGTQVHIKVKRKGNSKLLDFKIIRDKIPLNSIDASYMADKQTGYIRLSRFAVTSNNEFVEAFDKLKKEGMKNLILDLQSNGGGLLTVAGMLADQFLDKDKILYYTQGNKIKREDAMSSSKEKGVFESGKLVVLVDEYSASASEILAGAIQDWDRGVIIGRRTFGKGLVQRAINLPDGAMIRLTISRYYTPSGRNIQKPYEKGDKETYFKNVMNRYKTGELINADSIHFPDSLKYSTLVSGRTVYGGGGIMPDIFVPIDSITEYHVKLNRAGIINRFYISYIDKNRSSLKKNYPTFEKYAGKFTINNDMLQELVEMANKEKVEYNEEQFQKSKDLISLIIKALIADDLFDKTAYFRIYNAVNDPLQEALRIINNDEEYNKILKIKQHK